MPTPEDFLIDTAILVLPSGKKIYAYEPGYYHVQLYQIAPVTWTKYNRNNSNEATTQTTTAAGTLTQPLSHSYIGKYSQIPYVEIDIDNDYSYRAELNHNNFRSDELEALPSAEAEYAAAAGKSEEANKKHLSWSETLALAALGGVVLWKML